MEEKIKQYRAKIEEALNGVASIAALREVRAKFLSKVGLIPSLMKELSALPKEDRPTIGKSINAFKEWACAVFDEKEEVLAKKELAEKYASEAVDITMPAIKREPGGLHPVTLVTNQLISIFSGMGFKVNEGPEIEDDYHNFTALNTPKDHPARDKQDTFYITEEFLLRTQTSAVQIRTMENCKPPIKIISPGRVFRSDDDATHTPMFHQMEGLVIDKHLSLCDLHGLLDTLAKEMFGKETATRFRPSYFPFTEPSVEVDVSCFECSGKGCRLCKGTGWIEILGAGVVHRNVIANCGLDPDEYTGLAFGCGIDRIAMLKYGVNNIHILLDGDIRILKQFKK